MLPSSQHAVNKVRIWMEDPRHKLRERTDEKSLSEKEQD